MNKQFRNAIVRKPGQNMTDGITTAGLGKPDFKRALVQHENYIEALRSCDLKVEILDADENSPDSCFIEDVALCTPYCAIITRPGAESRRDETANMSNILEKYYKCIEYISAPGTLEAGDIMMVEDHYYIGLSERTNKTGANQLISILEMYGLTGSLIELKEVLHLKTGLAYLENNNLVACGEFITNSAFKKFNKIEIPEHEAYAANCIWVNGKVIVPDGFYESIQLIKEAGYQTIELEMSEFQKLDGGLSCLSLRF